MVSPMSDRKLSDSTLQILMMVAITIGAVLWSFAGASSTSDDLNRRIATAVFGAIGTVWLLWRKFRADTSSSDES